MLPGIGFDLDGTLLDHRTSATKAIEIAVSEWGWASAQKKEIGVLWKDLEEEIFPQYLAGKFSLTEQRAARVEKLAQSLGYEISKSEQSKFFESFLAHYENSWSPFPDVPPVLKLLHEMNFPMAVLTNGILEQQIAKLKKMDLLMYFSEVLAIGNLEELKPSPKAFHALARALERDPSMVVYVGDDVEIDIQGAISANLKPIWIDRNTQKSKHDQYRIESFTDLLQKIEIFSERSI